jgi:hypothetical protein
MKKAQAPPSGPPPGPESQAGLSTMQTGGPGSGGGGPAPEEVPAGPQSTFKVIYSPLDTLGKILADLDFKTFLENNFGTDPVDLAKQIWVMYGGNENELRKGKPGQRKENPLSDDPMQLEKLQKEEYNRTRNSRWKRLPEGKSIDEITNPQALEQSIIGGYLALAKENSKPAQSSALTWLKIAEIADKIGNHKYADKIEKIIKNVYSSR